MSGYEWTGWDVGTSATSTNLVWGNWLNSTNSTTSVSDTVWSSWNVSKNGAIYIPPPPTPEQLAAHEAEQARLLEEWRRQEEERKAKEAEAKRKAIVLLEENLTPEQLAQFKDNGWFEVATPKGTYRIRNGWSGNVDRINGEGRATDRYCIHPGEYVPTEDNMLAQKLMLEAMEEDFLRIANRSTPYA